MSPFPWIFAGFGILLLIAAVYLIARSYSDDLWLEKKGRNACRSWAAVVGIASAVCLACSIL